MTEKILAEKNLVVRHSNLELIEHWAVAVSGLLLIVTGIFELPVAKRYYIITIPGLGWSADFITSLYIHYASALVLTAAAFFHVFYHGLRKENGMIPRKGDIAASVTVIKSFFGLGKEPPMPKYLPEQRLAYAAMAFIIFMLIVSGLIKTYKNIYAPDMSLALVLTATWVHNIFFVFFLLAFLGHMAAIILRPNRPMVRGIFTGKVRLDYARHRHPLWLEAMGKKAIAASAARAATAQLQTEEQTPSVPETKQSATVRHDQAADAEQNIDQRDRQGNDEKDADRKS